MKRKLLILSVLAICIATLAAGTLAYFASEGKLAAARLTDEVSIPLCRIGTDFPKPAAMQQCTFPGIAGATISRPETTPRHA